MNEETTANDKQWIFDWLPLGFIVVGLALNWAGLDDHAWVSYLGFASYGILGLIELLNDKKAKKQILKVLKIAALFLILIISLISILGNPTYFVALLALVLLDRIIFTNKRV